MFLIPKKKDSDEYVSADKVNIFTVIDEINYSIKPTGKVFDVSGTHVDCIVTISSLGKQSTCYRGDVTSAVTFLYGVATGVNLGLDIS